MYAVDHARKMAEYKRGWRTRRKLGGLCQSCPSRALVGSTRCAKCLNRPRQPRWEMARYGLFSGQDKRQGKQHAQGLEWALVLHRMRHDDE